MTLSTALKKILLSLAACVALNSCAAQPALKVSSADTRLECMGRVKKGDSATALSWPGSSVAINFEGTEVAVNLKDETGDNYYYAVVDDGEPEKLRPDTVTKRYTIASHLKAGTHTALLYKLTESRTGRTWFYGFELNHDAKVLPSTKRDKSIEFYGNSITVGYSVDDTVGDSGAPMFHNNYFSYAGITARHYKARYNCIAKSGIGLMLSWFPIIMPEMYDRQEETDSVTKWDFKQYTPDIVVINLLQNDSWLAAMPNHPQFKARFGVYPPDEKYIVMCYRDFLQSIRSKYPNASIICALGSMNATQKGSPWPGYIEKAVQSVNDKKVYTHFFPYNTASTNKHPKRQGQAAMANDLIQFIDANVKW